MSRSQYFRNDRQKDKYIQPTTNETPGDNVNAVTQFTGCERVYSVGGNWSVDRYDGNGPQALTGNIYDPAVRVRGLSVADEDANGVTVVFDLPNASGVSERFVAGLIHPMWITRINFGATTATSINLYT